MWSSVCCIGTPEAQGKADYVSSIVAEINHRKGFTAGLSQVVARAFGALGKRRAALHQVRAGVCMPKPDPATAIKNGTEQLQVMTRTT